MSASTDADSSHVDTSTGHVIDAHNDANQDSRPGVENVDCAQSVGGVESTLQGWASLRGTKLGEDFSEVADAILALLQCLHQPDRSVVPEPVAATAFEATFDRAFTVCTAIDLCTASLARPAAESDAGDWASGNGYRSMLLACQRVCRLMLEPAAASKAARPPKPTIRFVQLLELLSGLSTMVHLAAGLAHELAAEQAAGLERSLFCQSTEIVDGALRGLGTIDSTVFYGKLFGVFYPRRLADLLKDLLKAFCGLSNADPDSWWSTTGALLNVGAGMVRYSFSAEARGKRVRDALEKCNIAFLKRFWGLQDSLPMAQQGGFVVSATKLSSNIVITIPVRRLVVPARPAQLRTADTGSDEAPATVTLEPVAFGAAEPAPEPVSQGRSRWRPVRTAAEQATDVKAVPKETERPGVFAWVTARLLAYNQHTGQINRPGVVTIDPSTAAKGVRPAKGLMVHFHGGGFVAQSSKSHEIYLRRWAKALRVPILCIDYTLAPEASPPQPLNECFYAYCWAISNCALLGSTGDRIVVAGDSAGGNFAVAVALRAVEAGVRRPDAVMASYPVLCCEWTLSPSRIMSGFDPLLPTAILREVIRAYLGPNHNTSTVDPFLSPLRGSNQQLKQLPNLYMVACGFDPLLDDAVDFARRLSDLGNRPAKFWVEQELTHGFLQFYGLGGVEVTAANERVIECLIEAFRTEPM